MKTTTMTAVLLCIAAGMMSAQTPQQQQERAQKHMMKEDSAAVNALVMYPDTIRVDIFEACEYPSAIVSIASLQKNSSTEFASLISGYTAVEQEDCWNLSRYPGLITRLVQEGKRSIDAIVAILKNYPAEIREVAIWYGTKNYDLLQKMDALQTKTDAQFDQILADYPSVTQEALRELVMFPEIISLLNDHLGLTVRVGDNYRRDPKGVIQQADSLNLAVTGQNAEDAAAWKQSIEENPEEAEDLKNAATDYATENGYSKEDVISAPEPGYVDNYVCYPYRYWFGYPAWYPYSYWYPYPFWFDCGFHFDRHGRIVIIGPPSRYFTNWYFYYPDHWRRYPRLCNTYINHYYGRRRTAGGNSGIVHNWVRERREYLPKDFIPNKSRRVEVIQQVAKLEVDVQRETGGRPVSPTERKEYLVKNAPEYPTLDITPKPKVAVEQNAIVEPVERPERQPAVRIMRPAPEVEFKQPAERLATPNTEQGGTTQPPAKTFRPADEPVANKTETTRPVHIPEAQPSRPAPSRTERAPEVPVYNFNRVQNAQEYQRNIWEQTQPAPRQPVQQMARPQVEQYQPSPRPQMERTQPAPAPRVQQPAPAKPAPQTQQKPTKNE